MLIKRLCIIFCYSILREANLNSAANIQRGAALLNGAHIVYTVYQNPPFESVSVSPNGTIILAGVSKFISQWISQKFNFTYSFAMPSEEEIKKYGGFTATEVIIQKGLGNITASSGIITPERRKYADEIWFPIIEQSVRLVVPRPSEEDRLFAFILPFDLWVWTLLAVSIVVTIFLMACLTQTSEKLNNQSNPLWKNSSDQSFPSSKSESFSSLLGSYTMWVIDVLTNHGNYLKQTYINPLLIFVTFWLLGISVVIYGYSCIVVSSLTAPRLTPAINSYEDLVASKEVSIIIRTDFALTRQIYEGAKPVFKQLTEKAKKQSPESIINDEALTEKLLLTGRYAFPFVETYVRFFIASQYKKEKKCRFQQSDIIRWSSNYFHQYVTKGAGYRETLTYGAMQLWETGLTRFWVRNLSPEAEECFAKRTQGVNQKQASIKLVDLTSAFFIFGVGIGLSLFCFIIELVYHSYCLALKFNN